MINTKPTFIETILRQIDSKQNSDSPEYLVSFGVTLWPEGRHFNLHLEIIIYAYFKAVRIETESTSETGPRRTLNATYSSIPQMGSELITV